MLLTDFDCSDDDVSGEGDDANVNSAWCVTAVSMVMVLEVESLEYNAKWLSVIPTVRIYSFYNLGPFYMPPASFLYFACSRTQLTTR